MFRFSKAFSTILCIALLITISADSILAHVSEMQVVASTPQASQQTSPADKQDKKAKKKEKRAAKNKNAKEFAGFEYTEAVAVTTVLKQLETPVPPMDPKAQDTLAKIK